MAAPLSGKTALIVKVSLLPLWLFGVACWLLDPAAEWVAMGRWVAPALLAAHLLELFAWVPMLKKAGRPIGPELGQLLVFGSVHFFSLDLSD